MSKKEERVRMSRCMTERDFLSEVLSNCSASVGEFLGQPPGHRRQAVPAPHDVGVADSQLRPRPAPVPQDRVCHLAVTMANKPFNNPP